MLIEKEPEVGDRGRHDDDGWLGECPYDEGDGCIWFC